MVSGLPKGQPWHIWYLLQNPITHHKVYLIDVLERQYVRKTLGILKNLLIRNDMIIT